MRPADFVGLESLDQLLLLDFFCLHEEVEDLRGNLPLLVDAPQLKQARLERLLGLLEEHEDLDRRGQVKLEALADKDDEADRAHERRQELANEFQQNQRVGHVKPDLDLALPNLLYLTFVELLQAVLLYHLDVQERFLRHGMPLVSHDAHAAFHFLLHLVELPLNYPKEYHDEGPAEEGPAQIRDQLIQKVGEHYRVLEEELGVEVRVREVSGPALHAINLSAIEVPRRCRAHSHRLVLNEAFDQELLRPDELPTLVVVVLTRQIFQPLDETIEADEGEALRLVGRILVFIVSNQRRHQRRPDHVDHDLDRGDEEAEEVLTPEDLEQGQVKVDLPLLFENLFDTPNFYLQVVFGTHSTQLLKTHRLVLLSLSDHWLDPVPVQFRPYGCTGLKAGAIVKRYRLFCSLTWRASFFVLIH